MMFRTKTKYQRCYAGMAQIGWNSISSYWDPNKPFTKVLSEHTNPRITRSELAMSILQHPQQCKQAKDPATSSRRAAPFSFPRPCRSTKHSISIHQHCSSTLYSGRIFLATEVRTLLEKKLTCALNSALILWEGTAGLRCQKIHGMHKIEAFKI